MTRLGRWRAGRAAVIGVPSLWLAVFFLLPFLVVAKISVSEMETTTFKDIVAWKDGAIAFSLNFGNYLLLVQDSLYFNTFVSSLKYAAVTTLLCLAIGYPFAYFMARARAALQPALLMLVMLPFWTSFLLRVYAWKALLTEHGLVAEAIEALGLDRVRRQPLLGEQRLPRVDAQQERRPERQHDEHEQGRLKRAARAGHEVRERVADGQTEQRRDRGVEKARGIGAQVEVVLHQ